MALLREGSWGGGPRVPGFLGLAGAFGKVLGGLSFPVCGQMGTDSNGFGSVGRRPLSRGGPLTV